MTSELLSLLTNWTDRTLLVLEREIERWRINDTGDLKRSLESEVRKKSAEILESQIEFLVRGRFIDMGAGRGQRANGIESRAGNRALTSTSSGRKPRRWYSRALWGRLNDLQGVLGYTLMESSVQAIKGHLDKVK